MSDRTKKISELSPEKRALIEHRIAKRKAQKEREVGDLGAARPNPAPERPAAEPGSRPVPPPGPAAARARSGALDFSLFYFASNSEITGSLDRMEMVTEGAKFADRHGFKAIWTPERHFHEFGGLFPNPSVTAAAIAGMTEQVELRAGSVVLPLHHPVRVAEEWSVVDNYSGGRAGVAFASGWHANDFVLAPHHYENRRDRMFRDIDVVQRLWRGERIEFLDGAGKRIPVEIFPKPVQPELPIWITATGSPETWNRAGAIGANILTHLLGQSVEDLAGKIERYRKVRAEHGHDPETGIVTIMLHTFLGPDLDEVREVVQKPFCDYIRSFTGLLRNLARSMDLDLKSKRLTDADMDSLLRFAFDRYFETSGLFGTLETCRAMVDRLKAAGVTEVACLIDFGVDRDLVLGSLGYLDELRADEASRAPGRAMAGESPP